MSGVGFLGSHKPPSGGETANGSEESGLEGFKNPQSIQRLFYLVGPARLSGKEGENELLEPITLPFKVKEPLWVTGFIPRVVDSAGSPLPNHLLYKAILLNKNQSNPVCDRGGEGNPWAVANATLTPIYFPKGLAYAVTPNDAMEARVIFRRPDEGDIPDVFFSFEIEAIPMAQDETLNDLQPLLLDTDPCTFKPLAVEPGLFVEKNETFTVPENGDLRLANAILSDYGVAVSLTHQEGKEITVVPFWRAQARLDQDHRILDLSDNPFLDPSGKTIRTGDKLTLGVAFNNFSDEWLKTATGAAMVYLAPAP